MENTEKSSSFEQTEAEKVIFAHIGKPKYEGI
jgi:hypothetical protein